MKKNKNARRLKLNKTTVKTLSSLDLENAQGGTDQQVWPSNKAYCSDSCELCPIAK
jgi:hypothetical protein